MLCASAGRSCFLLTLAGMRSDSPVRDEHSTLGGVRVTGRGGIREGGGQGQGWYKGGRGSGERGEGMGRMLEGLLLLIKCYSL